MTAIIAAAGTWLGLINWQLTHNTGPALIVAGGILLMALKIARVAVQWWLERKLPKKALGERRGKRKHEQAMAWGEWTSVWGLMVFGAILTLVQLYLKAECK